MNPIADSSRPAYSDEVKRREKMSRIKAWYLEAVKAEEEAESASDQHASLYHRCFKAAQFKRAEHHRQEAEKFSATAERHRHKQREFLAMLRAEEAAGTRKRREVGSLTDLMAEVARVKKKHADWIQIQCCEWTVERFYVKGREDYTAAKLSKYISVVRYL